MDRLNDEPISELNKPEVDQKYSVNADNSANNTNETHDESGEEKREDEEDEEEEEEEEEDRIIEKSPNLRFHKRNKKYMRKVPGIDNSYIAIEPKSGKEVIWNEVYLSDKKTDQENRFMNVIKKLKKFNHPFFVRYLEVWTTKEETNRKIIFVTERLTDPTMKQYFVNSSSTHRLPNKALWRKFVGQLMSVLKFLNNLGVNHGNLSNETVYYQNTGSLKVGTLSVDLNFENKSSADIYDLGKLVLEMAAYEAADDGDNLSVKDRIQKMLSRLNDSHQINFIETCLNNLETPTSISNLFQHPVLKEVPSLKRLAAKRIVSRFNSKDDKNDKDDYITKISNNLREQVSHFEDETVLFKVTFKKENIIKMRLWKEFRVNFANLSKYIEDVKNGFYPIFQPKGSTNYEDGEEITYSIEQEKDQVGFINKESTYSLENHDREISKPVEGVVEKSEQKIDEPTKENKLSKDSIATQLTEYKSIIPEKQSTSSLNVKTVNSTTDNKIEHNQTSTKLTILNENEEPTESNAAKVNREVLETYDENEEKEEEEYEEEEEDIGEKGNAGSSQTTGGTNSPYMPSGNYVSPPDKAPSDRALFTSCLYSYLGCGRWHIYVQMWFLEDRLKREVIIQLSEYDWAQDGRVARLFQKGHLIPAVDTPILEKILSLARHNCPLIDGKLIPLQKQLGDFCAYDLYQRLEHLQMCTKARHLLEKAEEKIAANTVQKPNQTQPYIQPQIQPMCDSAPHGSATESPTQNNQAPNPTQGHATNMTTPADVSGTTTRPTDINLDKLCNQEKSLEERSAILKGFKVSEIPGFKLELIDIRILAPSNFSCMYCDNHDYLHSEDLPPFLTSPCYHCRESYAKEAKIAPRTLFDLHQQHYIPWPAFLQVRFNIPPVKDYRVVNENKEEIKKADTTTCDDSDNYQGQDSNNTVMDELWYKSIDELIAYDCKWRSRSPCNCYSDKKMPPCVEFPNLYDGGQDNKRTFFETESSNILPCANRHGRGAVMTCVHGFNFPRLMQNHQKTQISTNNSVYAPFSAPSILTQPNFLINRSESSGLPFTPHNVNKVSEIS